MSNTNPLQRYEQVGVAMTCRSFAEYERMFDLDEELLSRGPILDVAAGASSFTAEARSKGYEAMAVDPQYALTRDELYANGREEIEVSTAKLAKLQHQYDWSFYGNIDLHKQGRLRSLETFIADFNSVNGEKVYRNGRLPHLPLEESRYALILCSHFLFLYHHQFNYEFHRDAVLGLLGLCRPGGEIRLYPVFTLSWVAYPCMERLLADLHQAGAETAFLPSKLPFIPGSGELLQVVKQAI
ncbi:methylase [Paenibacillus thalictri]|nr:methylase [Paenibacillus thalictri]